MKKLRFKKIDAFASRNSSGNPAAVIYLERLEELTEDEKLRIAQELKGFVSEVGYVAPGKQTDYELCYYSSEREVAFCGHATIAIMHDIIGSDAALQSRASLTIATRDAMLQVENRFRADQSVYISAPVATFSKQEARAQDIAAALNSPVEDLDAAQMIQVVNAGLETLIVPMTGLDAILRLAPDLQRLKEYCLRIGVDIIIVYCSEVACPESRYRTRVFAPTFGYLEDPATGSGNAALGYYLLAHGLWKGEMITIEQNGDRQAPNFVKLFGKTDPEGRARVWFGGGAVVKIDGHYNLYQR